MSPHALIASIPVRGQVRGILRGPVFTEVEVDTPAGIVATIVNSRVINALRLKVGSEVLAQVHSTEVTIARQ